MRYIKIIDTAFCEKEDNDNSFIIAVDEEEYELLLDDLRFILDNQEDYDNVYEAMMDCVADHYAERIEMDWHLEW